MSLSVRWVAALECSDRRLYPRRPKEHNHRAIRAPRDLRLIYDGRAAPSNSELLTANPDPLLSPFPAKMISFPGAEGEVNQVANSQRRMILLQSLS